MIERDRRLVSVAADGRPYPVQGNVDDIYFHHVKGRWPKPVPLFLAPA
jgi:hypothetical protein